MSLEDAHVFRMQEYDAAMLEMFELRTQLAAARQELAASLYQHDAACRVIARLSRDRDAATAALESLRTQLAAAPAAAAAAAPPEVGAKRPRPDVRPAPGPCCDRKETITKHRCALRHRLLVLGFSRCCGSPQLPGAPIALWSMPSWVWSRRL